VFKTRLSHFSYSALGIVSALLFTLPAGAEETDNGYRWFEVEVLIFRHNQSEPTDPERFPIAVTPIPTEGLRDLVGTTMRPHLDGLLSSAPRCSYMQDLPANVGQLDWPITRYPMPPLPNFDADIFCRPHTERIITDSLYPQAPEQFTIEFWQQRLPTVSGEGGDIRTAEEPFLMPREAFTFNEVRAQLERRHGADVLLHTVWRQPVFNRSQARPHRLFGGENFTKTFDYFGFAKSNENEPAPLLDMQEPQATSAQVATQAVTEIPSERQPLSAEEMEVLEQIESIDNLLQAIESGDFQFAQVDSRGDLLPSPPAQYPAGLPSDVWELDGSFQLYLVGNYLHINSQLNVREPETFGQQLTSAPEQVIAWRNGGAEQIPFLRGYYLNQLRRIISHEVHYFDHDKFGMLVQVRRTELSDRR